MSLGIALDKLQCVGGFFKERVGVTLILTVSRESCEKLTLQ